MLLHISPGKSRTLPSTFATGKFKSNRYILFVSQDCVVVYSTLDFRYFQTLDLGLGDGMGMVGDDPDDNNRYFPTSVALSEATGKIAVACGHTATIFRPLSPEAKAHKMRWIRDSVLQHSFIVRCVHWNPSDSLVTAGQQLIVWRQDAPSEVSPVDSRQSLAHNWHSEWMQELGVGCRLAKFSPDGAWIATVGENDYLVKIWFAATHGNRTSWAFNYLRHPDIVRDFTWRSVRESERSSTPPFIYTRCADYILRIFTTSNPLYPHHFYLVAHIDPFSCCNVSMSPPPKIVHWIDNEVLADAVSLGSPPPDADINSPHADDDRGGTEWELKLKHLHALVKDAPDMFLGVSEDGSITVWGVQNLSATPWRIPRVLVVMRMPQALLPSDEPYFGGNCLIYYGMDEFTRNSGCFPCTLMVAGQSPSTGKVNVYSLSLTDFFDSARSSSRLFLRHSWGGHDAIVCKVTKSEYDDGTFISIDNTGCGVFWRREIPTYLRGRVREGLIEIGEIKGRSRKERAVRREDGTLEEDIFPEETEENLDAMFGGCKVVTFLPTGHHVAVFDGENVLLYHLRPTLIGYLEPIVKLQIEEPFTRDDPLVLLHSFESPNLSPTATTPTQPPLSLMLPTEQTSPRRYFVIIGISQRGRAWTWGCQELDNESATSACFDVRVSGQGAIPAMPASRPTIAKSDHKVELDLGSLRLLHVTPEDLVPAEIGPLLFSIQLKFPSFRYLHTEDDWNNAGFDDNEEMFVSYSHGDRTIRSWAWNWRAIQSGRRNVWVETAYSEIEGSAPVSVMRAAAMGKVAIVTDNGYGYSLLEIWGRDPGSKDFEQEHAVEFSPATGPPVDVSWLLVSDSHQLLAVAFYDRVAIFYPVRQRLATEEAPSTDVAETETVLERKRRLSGGRRRSTTRRQSLGRRGSIVMVMDATGKMRRDGGWMKVVEISIASMTNHPIGALSWARNGSLIVAAGNKLFCYNKWVVQGGETSVVTPPPRCLSNLPSTAVPSAVSTVFNLSHTFNSVLPHHHPQLLVQYLLWGKLELVKHILMYLHRFLAMLNDARGEWSPDGIKVKHGLPSLPFTQFLQHDQATTLKTPASFSRPSLFDDDVFGDQPNRMKAQVEDTFTEEAASFLTEQLTKTSLPGITNVEQMFLMAIIDTVVQVERQKRSLDENGVRYLLFARLYAYLVRSSPVQFRPTGLASRDIAWAFHSESQDILLEACSNLCGGKILWKDARAMGIALWVRNPDTLRQQMEIIARNQYMAKDPRDPIDASIYFLALRKRKLLHGLWKTANAHPEQTAMVQFLANDFDEERWRNAALKNAFALLGRQRYEYAAAFFLLGDSLSDAVSVCLKNLADVHLAIAICRAYEGDDSPVLAGILKETVIPTAVEKGDRWMANMAFTMLKQRERAIQATMLPLQTFLPSGRANASFIQPDDLAKKKEETDPALLVLFGFLCRQMSGIRQHRYKVDPEEEEEFVIRSVIAYEKFGCPLLALRVLESWVVEKPPRPPKLVLSKRELHRAETIKTGALDWDWETSANAADGNLAEATAEEIMRPTEVCGEAGAGSHKAEGLFSEPFQPKKISLFDDDEPPKKISLFDDEEVTEEPSCFYGGDAESSLLEHEKRRTLTASPANDGGDTGTQSLIVKDIFGTTDLNFLIPPNSNNGMLDQEPETAPATEGRSAGSKPIGARLKLYKITLGMQLLEHVVSAVHVASSYATVMRRNPFFCEYLNRTKEGLEMLCKVIDIKHSLLDRMLISRCFETDSFSLCFHMLTQGVVMSEQNPQRFVDFLVDGSNNIAYLAFQHTSAENSGLFVNLGVLAECILSTFREWFVILCGHLPRLTARLSTVRVVILSFFTHVVSMVEQQKFDRLALCLFHCHSLLDVCESEADLQNKLPALLEMILKGDISMPTGGDASDDEMFSDDMDEDGMPKRVDSEQAAVADKVVMMHSLQYMICCLADFLNKMTTISEDLAVCLRLLVLEPLANMNRHIEDDIRESPYPELHKGNPTKMLMTFDAKKCWAILDNLTSTSAYLARRAQAQCISVEEENTSELSRSRTPSSDWLPDIYRKTESELRKVFGLRKGAGNNDGKAKKGIPVDQTVVPPIPQ